MNKAKKKEPVTTATQVDGDVLDAIWNVGQIKLEELDSTTPGIVLVRPAEAREILLRPKATVPQAILCTIDVIKTGAGMDVLVTDSKQKPQTRWKYLYQTGSGTVAVDTTSIPKGGACKSKTVLVVATVNSVHAKGFLELTAKQTP